MAYRCKLGRGECIGCMDCEEAQIEEDRYDIDDQEGEDEE